MSDTPVHDWLRPRLIELLRQAEIAGLERAIVVAVLTDLVTAPPFNGAEPDSGSTPPAG